jgi:hypothetical protein
MEHKLLCYHCIDDDFLKSLVFKNGDVAICDFCQKTAQVYTLGILAEMVDKVFNTHYMMSFPEPPDYDQDGMSSAQAITDVAGIPENAAEQIREILEDQYYDYDSMYYAEAVPYSSDTYCTESSIDTDDLEKQWLEFEQMLKSEARFFNTKGYALLESIFTGINTLTVKGRKSTIVKVGPGQKITYLYRARVFQSENRLQEALASPVAELGSPPSNVATAGRMNAQGIAVFYGADTPDTAIAEVRPPVGSEVVVSRFDILEKLNLLDLTALQDLRPKGSLFDPIFSDTLRKAKFLKNLSNQMAKPVMPDAQNQQYLITQAIADFLSFHTSLQLDGIIYPSVQIERSGVNIMLFNKSSRVKQEKHGDNIKLSAQVREFGPDGYVKMYSISEQKISDGKMAAIRKLDPFGELFVHSKTEYYRDHRKPVLRLDTDTIKVHVISGVSFSKTIFSVNRYNYEDTDDNKAETLPF